MYGRRPFHCNALDVGPLLPTAPSASSDPSHPSVPAMFAFDESAQTYRRRSPNLPKIYTNVHDYACPIEDLIEMYQAQKQEAATAHAVKIVPQAQRVIVGFSCPD